MKTNKYIKIDTELELSLYKFIENSSKPTERKRAMAILMNSNRQSEPTAQLPDQKTPIELPILGYLNGFSSRIFP
jgi:hypothetical protein